MFGWLIRSRRGQQPDITRSEVKSFYSSIAGVGHRNRNRTSRQKIIRESLFPAMVLELRPEDDNPVDSNAVALLAPSGDQVGYLNSRLASDVRSWLDEGMQVIITVLEITGGTGDKTTYGVNILVQVYEKCSE